MKPFTRVLSAFAVGILLQGGIYLYLDQYMFAPTTEFNVAGASKDDTKNFPDVKEGTKYYPTTVNLWRLLQKTL